MGSPPPVEKMMLPVPKVIHQTAPADRSRWHVAWDRLRRTWASACKAADGYRHPLWDDEDLRELVENYAPEYADVYTAYPAPIYRVDFARVLLLLAFGGVYADMDVEVGREGRCPFLALPATGVGVAENREAERRSREQLSRSEWRAEGVLSLHEAYFTCT